jgi:phage host-nuclease inhibitor protein Gam
MGKPKKLKVNATPHNVPQSRDEVTQAIELIGIHSRERVRIETEMNDRISKIKTECEELAAPLNARIVELQAGVQIWCTANRAQLTNDGKVKTVNFGAGKVLWRMTPSSVGLSKVAEVLKALKALGLERLIRIKEEVNKDAILLEPEAVADIKGISIGQHEEFVIEPFEAKLEEVA